jgi:hypothetical protein
MKFVVYEEWTAARVVEAKDENHVRMVIESPQSSGAFVIATASGSNN